MLKRNVSVLFSALSFVICSGMYFAWKGWDQDDVVGKPLEHTASVFYPRHASKDCSIRLDQLKSGRLTTEDSKLPLSLEPDWSVDDFELHSLRFLHCLILHASEGNKKSFLLAKDIIFDWDTNTKFSEKANKWTWKDNHSDGEEHGASWRAVLISYFYRTGQKQLFIDKKSRNVLQRMAKEHAQFLSSDKPYMPDHNHGLNNALGLLALGTSFPEIRQSDKWIELSISRAEQQMEDNVSEDGIYLEHSGFYHYYVLRTFSEIYRNAGLIGIPLSLEYQERLDRMYKIASLMAGEDGIVRGVPWNNHLINVYDYLDTDFSTGFDISTSGIESFGKFEMINGEKDLFLHPEGGFNFLVGNFGQALEIFFQSRILPSPHFQPSALSVTAELGAQRLLSYGNYTNDARLPIDFNTVLVDELRQGATLIHKPKPPLRKRLVPDGGEILSFGEFPQLTFITAQNRVYEGVTHTRTIARISETYFLVWDYLEADRIRDFTQMFHFPVPAQIEVQNARGVVKVNEKQIAEFFQLEPSSEVILCDEKFQDNNVCSQQLDEQSNVIPTPEINYRTTGKEAEFIWFLSAGNSEINVEFDASKYSDPSIKCLVVLGQDGDLELSLHGGIKNDDSHREIRMGCNHE